METKNCKITIGTGSAMFRTIYCNDEPVAKVWKNEGKTLDFLRVVTSAEVIAIGKFLEVN